MENSSPLRNEETTEENEHPDPSRPKRPGSAFILFLEEFRKSYSESNGDTKTAKVVMKAGGCKWREMTEEEKGPFLLEASQRMAEYHRAKEKTPSALSSPRESTKRPKRNQVEGNVPFVRASAKTKGKYLKRKQPYKMQTVPGSMHGTDNPHRFHIDLHADSDEYNSDDD
eukprot:c17278_g1_i2 orf=182-691(+)